MLGAYNEATHEFARPRTKAVKKARRGCHFRRRSQTRAIKTWPIISRSACRRQSGVHDNSSTATEAAMQAIQEVLHAMDKVDEAANSGGLADDQAFVALWRE